MYVYKQTEFGQHPLWTVGYYRPDGVWESESDHGNSTDAQQRVIRLNGGIDDETKFHIAQIYDYLQIFHREGIRTN